MAERQVLEWSLFVFAVGFLVKGIVFARLWWVMRHQHDRTSLGRALRWHYSSLALQAVVLAAIYAYYYTAINGHGEWVSAPYRTTVYLVATVLVIWAALMGVRLMTAYWGATKDSKEDTHAYSTD